MTNQEMTPEEEARFIGLQKNLFNDEFVKNIALSATGDNTDRYGSFGKDVLKGTYESTVSQVPNQEAYSVLFSDALLGEGYLGKEQLKKNAIKVWMSSMAYQNTNDLIEKMGYEGEISEEFSGKMVGELGKEAQKMISSMYTTYELSNIMKKGIEAEQKQLAKGLESILAPQKEESSE